MPKPVALTLLSKPGCHLCEDARAVIDGVLRDLEDRSLEVSLEERNILDDPELARVHAEDIPVVQINGRRHAIWRVDPVKLTAAIERAAAKRWRIH
ncbi:glutaredoxin family protein [Leucobacter soli]|uniref:Glutaredoxin family protein n=1 Tax=Leucobacter soli TaxID=2812850 RepID=A0A916NHA1_9MICO|nr:glutaredoxin family protein [Leucobacter soli]CAG7612990.1 hypothetical protein LEUCIP111803_01635 [Leucobacter soli]